MAVGAFVAVSNVLQTDVTAQQAGKWVHYDKEAPDCKGPGNTCYDMTTPPPVEN